MSEYKMMSKQELLSEQEALLKRFEEYKAMGLKLDMSRGKPSKEQLDLSMDMLKPIDYTENGFDVRNYGILDGLQSCKELFAQLLDVDAKNVLVGPAASLNLMYDYVCQCYCEGVLGSTPWSKLDSVKFLCLVPGYDRHFTILEHFGIEMINVPMTAEGPDMEVIEELIKDESVKGMFCVPKYKKSSGYYFQRRNRKAYRSYETGCKGFQNRLG